MKTYLNYRLIILLISAVMFDPRVLFALDEKSDQPLRHLAIPYAHFNTGYGLGFDVELVKRFAEKIGRPYQYVETDWQKVIPDLIGKDISVKGDEVTITGDAPIRGDIICTGFTVLPWREKLLTFSDPTFPTQVWLVTHQSSTLIPIKPSGNTQDDIKTTRNMIKGRVVMGIKGTCLDPLLYGLDKIGVIPRYFEGNINDLAGVLIKGETETILLDAPDTFVAMETWPGQIKIIGPVSEKQLMACAFRKEDKSLLGAFNEFLKESRISGLYTELVEKYYPAAFIYFPEFFHRAEGKESNGIKK